MADHEDQSKDGGIATAPLGAAAAYKAFKAAVESRSGPKSLTSNDPERDTGASTTPA